MSRNQILQGVYSDLLAILQLYKLTETEAIHVVLQFTTRKIGAALLQVENGRAGIHYLQRRETVVDILYLGRPIGVFVNLVYV